MKLNLKNNLWLYKINKTTLIKNLKQVLKKPEQKVKLNKVNKTFVLMKMKNNFEV